MGQPPKLMVFGSCLSNLTAAHLVARYGFRQTHSVHHNRSDAFLNYHINRKVEMIPLACIESRLAYKASSESEARQFLRNQYRETLGFHDLIEHKRPGKSFFDDIDELSFDLILLDGFMDIAAKLVRWKTHEVYFDQKLFLNLGFYENEAELAPQFWHDEFLTVEDSAANWIQIYHWIRERQPDAKIYFLSYHYCSSLESPERHARIKGFYSVFSRMAEGLDLRVLPPLNVRAGLLKGEIDWPHFEPPVYEALAGVIYLDYETGFLGAVEGKGD